MEGVLYAIFWMLEKCGRFVARHVFGPMPQLDMLSAADRRKVENDFQLDLRPNQLWVWLAAATPMVVGMVLFVVLFHDIWELVFALALLSALALTPFVSFINYRYERRRILRNLGKLERLPHCPACDYDLSHTEGKACPECGELIAPLQPIKDEINED